MRGDQWLTKDLISLSIDQNISIVPHAQGAFLAAAVWGGQRGGQICIWGPRIPDDIMHD